MQRAASSLSGVGGGGTLVPLLQKHEEEGIHGFDGASQRAAARLVCVSTRVTVAEEQSSSTVAASQARTRDWSRGQEDSIT
jgi:hypothetical protein